MDARGVFIYYAKQDVNAGSFVSQRHQQRVPQKSQLTVPVHHHIHQFGLCTALFRNPICILCRVMLIVAAAAENDTSGTDNANKLFDLLPQAHATPGIYDFERRVIVTFILLIYIHW